MEEENEDATKMKRRLLAKGKVVIGIPRRCLVESDEYMTFS